MLSTLREALNHLDVKLRSLRPVPLKYPRFGNLEEFCRDYVARTPPVTPTRTLDLGCGSVPRNPFGATALAGIDIRENPALDVRYADLAIEPIPFEDASFDYVTAFDFLEHVPRVLYLPERRFPFVELMNEIYRVLKPGGTLLSFTPAFPFGHAFRDPTHVNILTETTFPIYFDDQNRHASIYGFRGAFQIVRQGWRRKHLVTVMRKAEVR